MKTLLISKGIMKHLQTIASEAVERFGSSDWRKAQNLLDAIAIARDYGGIYTFLLIFLDPIAGHHKKLEENDQQLFMKIHKILDEANTLYCELPEIDADEYTPEKISEYNAGALKYSYTMEMKESLEENYDMVKRKSKEEKNIIHFFNYCLLVDELENKLVEVHLLFSSSDALKE